MPVAFDGLLQCQYFAFGDVAVGGSLCIEPFVFGYLSLHGVYLAVDAVDFLLVQVEVVELLACEVAFMAIP